MAQVDKTLSGVTSVGGGSLVNILHVAAELGQTCFGCIAMDVNASGTIATYYYWPNTSGVLRYGTTAPTVATQDTAGAAV